MKLPVSAAVAGGQPGHISDRWRQNPGTMENRLFHSIANWVVRRAVEGSQNSPVGATFKTFDQHTGTPLSAYAVGNL